jgi:serine protease Do
MHQSGRTFLLVTLGMGLGAAIFLLGSGFFGKREVRILFDHSPVTRETQMTPSFALVIARAAPSVVNIYTTKRMQEDQSLQPFFFESPFRRFFGDPRQRETQNLGSGVIVSEDGYILTNNHVVEGAEAIQVAFANSTRTVSAKIIGTDPQTDLAVIRINDNNLPAITLADSDLLEVGDMVLAIGNPFGVGQTVTMGIVSALGRAFGLVDYEDFIQTDASINPGNSGGALVDAEGRLIGINTVIFSGSGVNQGIGFAVPINMARAVMEQILLHGKAVRGFLGINMQPVTPELAKKLKVPDSGVVVESVMPESPAAAAGFKEGDVITEFQGKAVPTPRQLRLMVSQTSPKSKVTFKVVRNRKEQLIEATLGELPGEEERWILSRRSSGESRELLEGVEIGVLNATARRQFDVPRGIEGVLVLGVASGSPADRAGLRAGQVIAEINHRPVTNPKQAAEAVQKAAGDRLLVRVWSQGSSRYLVLP